MTPLAEYGFLAAVGLATGVLAHQAHLYVHGSFKRHLLLGGTLETLVVAPGITLAGIIISNRPGSVGFFDVLPLAAAFVLPYAFSRFAADKRRKGVTARRETAIPFEHWLDLLHTNPTQARAFLTAYLARVRGGDRDPVTQLTAACASLELTRRADPLLPGALEMLRVEIERVRQEAAALPPRAV